MTTVLDRPTIEPGTHVLAIGVGRYDHLIDGTGDLLDNPFGLGQLGSPPISAKSFTEWMLTALNNPNAQLASVEVLISSATPTSIDVPGVGPTPAAPATMANIQAAFDTWYARVNANKENVAVFYHCGHGLESSDLALLAQDFGAPGGNPPQPWKNAYNFHRTHLGMRLSVADAQFYFVDACRQVSADLLLFDGEDVAGLIAPRLRGLNKDRNAPILYSSARDSKAFARSHEVSRFTTAVIEAIGGNGAAHASGGAWKVTNDSLPKAVLKRVLRGNGPDVPLQIPKADGESTGTSILHVLDGPPLIPAYVDASVANPLPQSTRLQFRMGQHVSAEEPGPCPWELEVTADRYDDVVAMDGTTLKARAAHGFVWPPEYEEIVE